MCLSIFENNYYSHMKLSYELKASESFCKKGR